MADMWFLHVRVCACVCAGLIFCLHFCVLKYRFRLFRCLFAFIILSFLFPFWLVYVFCVSLSAIHRHHLVCIFHQFRATYLRFALCAQSFFLHPHIFFSSLVRFQRARARGTHSLSTDISSFCSFFLCWARMCVVWFSFFFIFGTVVNTGTRTHGCEQHTQWMATKLNAKKRTDRIAG